MMKAGAQRAVCLLIPLVVLAAVALGLSQTPAHQRPQALLLMAAVTLLTCSSVAGYALMKGSGAATLFSGRGWRGRLLALLGAAGCFGISCGSEWLLDYLLRHA